MSNPINIQRKFLALSLALGFMMPLAASSAERAKISPTRGGVLTTARAPQASELNRARHVLNRITFGPRPGDIEKVRQLGVDRYIDQQLNPTSIPMPQPLVQLVAEKEALTKSPGRLFIEYGKPAIQGFTQMKRNKKNGIQSEGDTEQRKNAQKMLRNNFKDLYAQVTEAKLMRAVYSPRQLEEVMTEFWYNHFNVSIDKGLDHLWVGSYEEAAIRPHVLGKFRDLLETTSHHAGMLFYLDNWQNTVADNGAAVRPGARKRKGRFTGLNENYARELMELHTLGVDGGYSQKDVVELAKVLTGHGLVSRGIGRSPREALDSKFGYKFDSRRHDFSTKVLLGHSIAGTGERELSQALDILARHPSTAKHISFKLCQYFVSDQPPPQLVDRVAKKFSATGGDIKVVVGEILHSKEFWDPSNVGVKYKTPFRYVVSSLRASDATINEAKPILGFLKQQGMPLYQCLTPDGYKNTELAWLSSNGLLQRINFATAFGIGRYPGATPREANLSVIENIAGVGPGSATEKAVDTSPERFKLSLLLGSPEFMRH